MNINRVLLPAILLNDTDTLFKFIDNEKQFDESQLNEISYDFYLIAVQRDNSEIVEILLKHYNVLNTLHNGQYLIHYCVQYNSIQCLNLLVKLDQQVIYKVNAYQQTAAHLAAVQNNTNIVNLLLNQDRSILYQSDIYGYTVEQYIELCQQSKSRCFLHPVEVSQSQSPKIQISNKFDGNSYHLYESQTVQQNEQPQLQFASTNMKGFQTYDSRLFNNAQNNEDQISKSKLQLSQHVEVNNAQQNKQLNFEQMQSNADQSNQKPKLTIYSDTLKQGSGEIQIQTQHEFDNFSNSVLPEQQFQFEDIDINDMKLPTLQQQLNKNDSNDNNIDLNQLEKTKLIDIIHQLKQENKQLYIDLEKTKLVEILSNQSSQQQIIQSAIQQQQQTGTQVEEQQNITNAECSNLNRLQQIQVSNQLQQQMENYQSQLEASNQLYLDLEKEYQVLAFKCINYQDQLNRKQIKIQELENLLLCCNGSKRESGVVEQISNSSLNQRDQTTNSQLDKTNEADGQNGQQSEQ